MTYPIRFDDVSKWFTLYHGHSRTLQERVLDYLHPGKESVSNREQFWALRNVSFTVEQGQTVGLVGSNGSGKSTALKLIARILEPTHGDIAIRGRVSALLELGAGFHPELTGRENIFLNGSLMGLSRKEMARNFDAIVDFSELEQFIDMPVKHYSSGMYMRLAFAVAIHVNPEILLVDEVLAVGDGAFQRKCMEYIGTLKRNGVTILMVSHDLETVARLCNRVVWLDEGNVREIGPGREVVTNYIGHINEQQQAQLERQRAAQKSAGLESVAEESAPEPVTNDELPGQAAITRIEIVDEMENPLSGITTGDTLIIRVHYRAEERIESPTFGLALHRDDDVHVTGPNTQVGRLSIDAIEGIGTVDYIVERAPLMAGRYYVSASLFDESCTLCYHYVHQLHSFLVQPRTVWDRLGVIDLGGVWRHRADVPPGKKSLQIDVDGVEVEALLAEQQVP